MRMNNCALRSPLPLKGSRVRALSRKRRQTRHGDVCGQPTKRPNGAKRMTDDAIPAGAVLPDGRLLTFSPSRACGCADCVAAFRALERDELRLPEGGFPWAA